MIFQLRKTKIINYVKYMLKRIIKMNLFFVKVGNPYL